jgi:molecular chaperone GrpE
MPQDMADDPWAQGVAHVARQFEQAMQEYGVEAFSPTGEPFDPATQEAIEQVKDAEAKSGMVLEVMQVGYKMGERIIRPAKVKVAA